MKLTKGKISKLYNKKNQTMKRKVNKKKGSNKNRTFRRKQRVNLARKSLKRLRYKKLSGGTENDAITPTDDIITVPKSEEVPDIFPPVVTEEANVTTPVADTVTDVNAPPTEDVNVPPTEDVNVPTEDVNAPPTEDVNAPPTEDVNALPTEDVNVPPTEDVNVPTEDVNVPTEDDSVPTEDVNVPTEDVNALPTEDVNVPTEDVNALPTEDVNVPPTEDDSVPTEDVNVPPTEEDVNVSPSEADLIAKENANEEYNNFNYTANTPSSIESKITDLVNEIASETAKKIEEKLTVEEVKEQNPADALMGVANRFGNESATGGGKKRRTRKFRIVQKQNRTKHHKRKHKNVVARGVWVNRRNNSVIENVSCPICLEDFSETPNKAIYQSDCGHLFHNDCLLAVCKGPIAKRICPLCRKPLTDDCSDVYAFRHKAILRPDDDENAAVFTDEEIQNIYEAQT